jgi:hypothetical protein
MPIAGRGFAFQLPMPEQPWLGGSRQAGQNLPPQCWQVKGRVHSLPQWSQRAITVMVDAHEIRIPLLAEPAGASVRRSSHKRVRYSHHSCINGSTPARASASMPNPKSASTKNPVEMTLRITRLRSAGSCRSSRARACERWSSRAQRR